MFTKKKKETEEQQKTGKGLTDFIDMNINNLKPIDSSNTLSQKHKKKDFPFIIPKGAKSSSNEIVISTSSTSQGLQGSVITQINSHQLLMKKPTDTIVTNINNNSIQIYQHQDQTQHKQDNNNQDNDLIYNLTQPAESSVEQSIEQPIVSPIPSSTSKSIMPSVPIVNPNDPPQIKFEKETNQTNIILFNQIEEYRLIISQINQIRSQVQKDKESKKLITQYITKLTNKQNQLIEANNFDEAIKVEEEIKGNINKMKVFDYSIQMQTETHLNKFNLEIINLFEAIVSQLTDQVNKIALLLDEILTAKDALNQSESKKLEELSTKIEQKTIDTNKLNIVLQSSIRQVQTEEKFFNKQIEQEAGHLLQIKDDLSSQKSIAEKEIEKLEKQLEAAKASLASIEEKIQSNDIELDKVKSKYEMDESYKLALLSKETSQSMYSQSSTELNKLKENYTEQNDVLSTKLEGISKIIKEINNFKTIKHPKYKTLMTSIIAMRDIIEKERENYNRKHINENTIEEYSNKLVDYNEKIEEIALQNKRIQSDILSLESNIINLDDVKKAHVAKKQFKDAQSVTIEIKKYIENKTALIEVFNENNEEAEIIKKEIENLNKKSESIKKEIEDITINIKENRYVYLTKYMDILTCFHEELFKDRIDNDNDVIAEEIKLIQEELKTNIKNKDEVNASLNNKNTNQDINDENKETIDEKELKETLIETKIEHNNQEIAKEIDVNIKKEEDSDIKENNENETSNNENKVQSKKSLRSVEDGINLNENIIETKENED